MNSLIQTPKNPDIYAASAYAHADMDSLFHEILRVEGITTLAGLQ